MLINLPQSDFAYLFFVLVAGLVSATLQKRFPDSNNAFTEKERVVYIALVLSAAVIGAFAIEPITAILPGDIVYGRSMLSALFFGWVSAEFIKFRLGIKQSTGDSLALGLAVGFSIARVGCLFGHCCYGLSYSGPLAFIHLEQKYLPMQLIEIAFHLSWSIILFSWMRNNLFENQRLRWYIGSYCLFRFIAEFWRIHPKDLAGLSIFQWISVALLMIILSVIALERSSTQRKIGEFQSC